MKIQSKSMKISGFPRSRTYQNMPSKVQKQLTQLIPVRKKHTAYETSLILQHIAQVMLKAIR